MEAYWQATVALVTTVSALGSLRSQGRPLSWRAVTALAAAAAILAGWPAVEVSFIRYTPIGDGAGFISDPLSGSEGWLGDGLFAGTLILMLAYGSTSACSAAASLKRPPDGLRSRPLAGIRT